MEFQRFSDERKGRFFDEECEVHENKGRIYTSFMCCKDDDLEFLLNYKLVLKSLLYDVSEDIKELMGE